MARITRVEIFQVDLAAPRSRAAMRSRRFSMQETPMLRIFCDDGLGRYRLLVHDRHRRLLGSGAAARPHGAAPAGQGSGPGRGDLEGPVLPHPRHLGRRAHQHRAVRGRYRAVGPALQGGRAAAVPHGRWRADADPGVRHRGRLAAPEARRSGGERAGGEGQGLSRGEGQDRPPARRRGRGAAGGGAQGARAGLRHHDRRQSGLHGLRGDPARPPLRSSWTSTGSRSRCPPRI